MNSFLGRFRNNAFAMGVFSLFAGAAAARSIGLLALPIVLRSYTPEQFGYFSILTASVTILVPIVTLRYIQALPLAKSELRAANILAFSWLISLAGILFVTTILAIAASRDFENSLFSALVEIAPFVILMLGTIVIQESFSIWSLRLSGYNENAVVHVIQSLVSNAVKIIFGFWSLKPLGLLVADSTSNSAATLFLLRFSGRSALRSLTMVSWRGMLSVMSFYRSFAFYRAPAQLLAMISDKAPIFFAAYLFNIETSGQLGLAFIVLAVPLQLIGHSMARVVYVELTKVYRNDRASSLAIVRKSIFNMVLYLSPLALVLAVFGPTLFSFVFGEKWRTAGVFVAILSVYLVARLIATALQDVFAIVSRQRLLLVMSAVSAMSSVLAFAISHSLQLDATATIAVFSGLLSIVLSIQIYLTYHVLRTDAQKEAARVAVESPRRNKVSNKN